LPELPHTRESRFVEQYGLPEYDAAVLTAAREVADYYEETLRLAKEADPKKVSNWVMGEVLAVLSSQDIEISALKVTPSHLAGLFDLMAAGTISGKIAKSVFEEMVATGAQAGEVVKAKGLVQITDSGELQAVVDRVVASNPEQVEQFRSGKDKVFGYFVGAVMKETRGKANPQLVNDMLRKALQ
ncbi:Asp-tRNA(Asn)/Glu-tRNA(Gln) amidotransferase GatCAB subunit B, partial [bacterium]|nr:Asp-tRNA(Asn)/Glu-tRNA(Gln) amidotransferase GatCAB subunit B [bacterium]